MLNPNTLPLFPVLPWTLTLSLNVCYLLFMIIASCFFICVLLYNTNKFSISAGMLWVSLAFVRLHNTWWWKKKRDNDDDDDNERWRRRTWTKELFALCWRNDKNEITSETKWMKLKEQKHSHDMHSQKFYVYVCSSLYLSLAQLAEERGHTTGIIERENIPHMWIDHLTTKTSTRI